MRKYLIAAIAALTSVALATVAFAQTPTAELTVKMSPTKAGTKKKPRNGKTTLKIVNGNPNRTLSQLKIWLPQTGRLNLKGFKACSEEKIVNLACPKSAALGSGIAEARAGVNTPAPNPLFFKVTPYPMSKTKIGFLLQQLNKDVNGQPTDTVVPGGITVVAPGTLKKAKKPYGQLLDISVPQIAREFPPGTFNGLVSLETTLTKKKGKNFLVSSTGCVKRGYPFKAELTFIPNPDPANAGKVTDTFVAKCTPA